jgi:hypothetical protein
VGGGDDVALAATRAGVRDDSGRRVEEDAVARRQECRRAVGGDR